MIGDRSNASVDVRKADEEGYTTWLLSDTNSGKLKRQPTSFRVLNILYVMRGCID